MWLNVNAVSAIGRRRRRLTHRRFRSAPCARGNSRTRGVVQLIARDGETRRLADAVFEGEVDVEERAARNRWSKVRSMSSGVTRAASINVAPAALRHMIYVKVHRVPRRAVCAPPVPRDFDCKFRNRATDPCAAIVRASNARADQLTHRQSLRPKRPESCAELMRARTDPACETLPGTTSENCNASYRIVVRAAQE